MSLTRKASSAAKKPTKPPRDDLAAVLVAREAELAEARSRQAATAEILRVISQSPTDARPVFERIVVAAARLLKCDMAFVLLREANAYVHAAGATPEGPMADLAPEHVPIDASANFPSRAFLAKKMLHLPDWSRIDLPEHERHIHETFGVSSSVYLPLLRQRECIGVLALGGKRANLFRPSEIAQAESFCDQALIAMENARLFRETQEALEQQKASAEVLGAISKSIADASPVFETILDACQRLFGSEELGIYTIGDDQMVRAAAWRGPRAEEARQDVTPLAESVTGRVIREGRPHHIPDLGAVPNLSPALRDRVNRHGGASLLYAPMVREHRGLGSIAVIRWPPRPFSDREQALLQTFADQAAIAIQNARLFEEVQASTRDLTEALLQQTATADVLRAINRAAFDLDAVLETLVSTAVRLCNAKYGQIFRRHGHVYRYAGSQMDVDSAYLRHEQTTEIGPGRGTLIGRVALERRTIQIADAWNDPEYAEKEQARIGGVRAMLGVPLMRDGEPIGAFALARSGPIPFTPREAELVQTFADQAVIAIENVRLFTETHQALERQTATADILKVIASSPTDVQPVFDAIAASANTLIGGFSTAVLRFVGETIHLAAFTPTNPTADEALRTSFPRALAEFPPFLFVRGGETIQFADTEADSVPPLIRDLARLRGYRSMLFAPLLSKGGAIGMISVTRSEPGAFAADHVQLLQTFADQAVIAVENVRLFDEVQARTRDLEEALQQQTATADVLKVISRSVSDVAPVFETIIESCQRLLGLESVAVYLVEGDVVRGAAQRGWKGGDWGRDVTPLAGSATGLAIAERRAVHVPNLADKPELPEDKRAAVVEAGGITVLHAPMLLVDRGVGSIVVSRTPARPFSEKEIALLKSFADQAAIAIQNTRLFNESEEALERQTATSEILRVISQSPTDARPVFGRIVLTAVRVLKCDLAGTLLRDGDSYWPAATANAHGLLTDLDPPLRAPIDTNANFPSRAILGKTMLHLPDWSQIELPPHEREVQDLVGINSAIYLPLLREGECVGVLVLASKTANAFGPKEIAQAESFRDQALIAIENARLFAEVQTRTRDLTEALEHQTATSEVLSAISRSPTEVQPVFDAIARSATELCGATSGGVDRFDGELIHLASHYNWASEALEAMRQVYPAAPSRGFASARAILTRSVVHISDISKDPEYTANAVVEIGFRSVLAVPMLRDGEPIGAIALVKLEPRPFTDRQIALLQTFADQAVIAINNVRLFDEVQARTRDLTEALKQQTATADVLKVISRSAFDLDAVLTTLTESARSLSGAATAAVFLRNGEVFSLRAESGVAPEFREYMNANPAPPGKNTLIGRVAMTGEAVHIPDVATDPDYNYGLGPQIGDYRAMFGAPLIRDGKVEGVFGLMHPKPAAFMPRQMEMVRAFADQAVIAIENARLFDEVQARTREVEEALAQQTATADVLKVISRSAFDLQTVLDTLASSAAGLIGANFVAMYLRRGDVIRSDATYGASPEMVRYMSEHPQLPGRETAAGRVFQTGEVQNISDVLTDPNYEYGEGPRLGNFRALLGVPMVRDGKVEGSFTLGRAQPGPFTQRQIELVQTFADQAIIAIENVRLFEEVRARTRDLEESLQQQTATSDILRVIASSPGDLQPVLDKLAETACRLCGAYDALVLLREGDQLRPAAHYGPIPVTFASQKISRGLLAGRAVIERRAIHIDDIAKHADEYPVAAALASRGAAAGSGGMLWRANLVMPLMREGDAVGVIGLRRAEAVPFSEGQIGLLKTFSDQAVIAIENVRLFDEVQARTRDLEESLQQQTATADVLKVISRSAFDLPTVLHTLVESAAKLCDAEKATITREIGGLYYRAEWYGFSDEFMREYRDIPVIAERGTISGRALLEGAPIHVDDVEADPEYTFKHTAAAGDFRTCLAIPMLRNGAPIGVLVMFRTEVRPFNARQIELVQTFADQAVIAIENVRLFDEVQARTRDLEESLAQQTATADVLKVISRSAFDLQAVLETLITTAVELNGAHTGTVCVRDGDVFRYRAFHSAADTAEVEAYLKRGPVEANRGSIAGRTILSGRVEQIPDLLEDPDYTVPISTLDQPWRALVGVPMLGKDRLEGVFTLTRREPGPYSPRQIEILQTFADQAVIAIENSRLFEEVQARTRELAASLDDLRKAQDRLIQSEKLASLGQLTAGIAHEIKNPLNFVNNFSALSRELVGELTDVIKAAPMEDARREEAEELMTIIGGNLDKVVQHGKRADSIVKNMLLHSREGSGERSETNINTMVEEALNLAYHGMRAEKPGFNVTIVKALDPNAGWAEVYAQEMTRVLLNLISNGFYATSKRNLASEDGAYEPTITASTRDLGTSVEIAIRDNGTGISDEVKAKMFNPFFTTKPAGEGTGLGLSLSHDIVVKQHGGTIDVATEAGEYTQFTIVLPRAGSKA